VVLLWPVIALYFWPFVIAYLFTGVYYILRDASLKIDRPDYLSRPLSIVFVCVFWFMMLILFFWRKWRRNSRHSFFKILAKQMVPLLLVFTLLAVDFTYLHSLMN
jgi:hypothetical protein